MEANTVKVEKGLTLEITKKLPVSYGKSVLNEENILMNELTPSFNGKYITVSYVV